MGSEAFANQDWQKAAYFRNLLLHQVADFCLVVELWLDLHDRCRLLQCTRSVLQIGSALEKLVFDGGLSNEVSGCNWEVPLAVCLTSIAGGMGEMTAQAGCDDREHPVGIACAR